MIPSSAYTANPHSTPSGTYLHLRLIQKILHAQLQHQQDHMFQLLLLHGTMQEYALDLLHQWRKSKQSFLAFLHQAPSTQLSLFQEEDPRHTLLERGSTLAQESDPKEWLRLLEHYISDFTFPSTLFQATTLTELAFRTEELLRKITIIQHQPWEAPYTETTTLPETPLPISHYPKAPTALAPISHPTPRISSYSQLSTLQECPYQFHLKYHYRFPETYKPKAHLGTLLHLAIERFYEEAPFNTHQQATRVFTQHLHALLPDPVPAEWTHRIAQVQSFFLTSVYQPEVTPLHSELPFSYTLNNITFKGRIDRIDETPTGLHIYDYKTGSINPTPIEKQLQL